MTVIEHLGEFRRRFIICIIAIVIAGIFCFIVSPTIISFLVRFYRDAVDDPDKQLQFLGPLDAFAIRLKIATYGGIVLALPVWLFQLWRFITPGLNPSERRYAVPFVLSSMVLFVFGAAVALYTLAPALSFLLTIGGSDLRPELTAEKYISLVSLMIVAFGIGFEFPVILTFLLLARIITTSQLRKWRRWALIGIFTFAAVITPSQDPYSLLAMAVPMYLFYEATIILGRILKR
ncbi:MAG TPA: twin-arginine translocase subunit TatC [Acidimicrobiia bacterium]|nr:twin-arginine translocase subunit TatC [Acidimicrobiia bacterium]